MMIDAAVSVQLSTRRMNRLHERRFPTPVRQGLVQGDGVGAIAAQHLEHRWNGLKE
jgi:hypothetical protein